MFSAIWGAPGTIAAAIAEPEQSFACRA